MQWRSLFASRSSTSRPGRRLRRREPAEESLLEARFLETLAESIAAVSGAAKPSDVLARTASEAKRLFRTSRVRLRPVADEDPAAPELSGQRLVVPIGLPGQPLTVLEISRSGPFHHLDLTRASVLAEFAARTYEHARLLAEAREREHERTRLSEQLITAEQDERRRLSIFLHDGPLQSLSGIAMMHDVALASLREGRGEEAAKVIESALDRERETIRTLRDLSYAIEPLVLRDQGFAAAVRGLADQLEQSQRVTVVTEIEAGELFAEKTQIAVYQIIREALTQAVRRQPSRVDVTIAEGDDGSFSLDVADDGVVERRRASIEQLEERVRILNGRLKIEQGEERGTTVRVHVPPYVAAAKTSSE